MRRRDFIASVGAAVAAGSVGARAQQAGNVSIVGWLGGSTREVANRNLKAFLQGLKEYGHEDGRDIQIVYRWANGDISLHPALARELIASNSKVVLAAVTSAIVALKRANASTPIVGPLLVDPIGYGFAEP